jgi:hypothetical protein
MSDSPGLSQLEAAQEPGFWGDEGPLKTLPLLSIGLLDIREDANYLKRGREQLRWRYLNDDVYRPELTQVERNLIGGKIVFDILVVKRLIKKISWGFEWGGEDV